MLANANFLCEIGTEEIPAGYLPSAVDSVDKVFRNQLTGNRIDFEDVQVFATPRRIAVLVAGLADRQREEETELKGPALNAAYNADGSPAKPLLGFMKGNGVTEKDLFKKDLGKGEYIFARKHLDSKATLDIVPDIIKSLVHDLPFPKRMHWGDKTVTFPRPVDYFAVVFNNETVPFELDGIPSSCMVRGHYIQHNQMLPVTDIKQYENLLLENSVIVDQAKRKEIIRKQLNDAAAKAGCTLYDDEDLLNTVTFIVENPHVVVCDFDSDFLHVPDIALIAEMKENQKYFPLYGKDGKLSNRFLVVANNPATSFIKAGNERVITARFSDARFFYTEDRKTPLAGMVDSLKSVLFHKELGSIYDKIERMQKVASVFAEMTKMDSSVYEKAKRAVMLCKADLNTSMVFEFSSLQGKMGRIYALEDGEDPLIADAIEDHYKAQSGQTPSSMVSVCVSIAEKLDNIFGSFSVGNIPKGSADPYALRRQANAVVEMLIKNNINLQLKTLLEKISGSYKNGAALVDQILEFITARVKTIFTESGFRYDEIEACLSTGFSDFTELYRRAESLHAYRARESFSQMLLSFKRMNNILSGFFRDNSGYKPDFNESLLKIQEEKDLYAFFGSRKEKIAQLISESRYTDLFELLTEGKQIIDAFFDSVLVMDEDRDVRDTRLALLENILGSFSGLMDFSKISDK